MNIGKAFVKALQALIFYCHDEVCIKFSKSWIGILLNIGKYFSWIFLLILITTVHNKDII